MNNLELLLTQLKSQPEIIKTFLQSFDTQERITYQSYRLQTDMFSAIEIIVRSLDENLLVSCYNPKWSTLDNLSDLLLVSYEEGKLKVFEKAANELLTLMDKEDVYFFNYNVMSVMNLNNRLSQKCRDTILKTIEPLQMTHCCNNIIKQFNSISKDVKKRKTVKECLTRLQYNYALATADLEYFKILEQKFGNPSMQELDLFSLKIILILNQIKPELSQYLLDNKYIEPVVIHNMRDTSVSYCCDFLFNYYSMCDIRNFEYLESKIEKMTATYSYYYRLIKDNNIAKLCYNGDIHASFSGQVISLERISEDPAKCFIFKDFFESAGTMKVSIFEGEKDKKIDLNEDDIKLIFKIIYKFRQEKLSPKIEAYLQKIDISNIKNRENIQKIIFLALEKHDDAKIEIIESMVLNELIYNTKTKSNTLKI